MINRQQIVTDAAKELKIADEIVTSIGLVAKHSEFIGIWLTNNLDKLVDICARFGTARDKQTILDDILAEDIYKMSETEFLYYLRFFKMREYTYIAANDLYFEASVEKVTAHVAAFAAASCQAAYLYARNDLKWEHGLPRDEDGNEIGFCVIGLGKLGGWELNFSSDIDVIYVYGSDNGKTDGQRPIETHVYFSKISEKITKYIGERTKDGIVFRVDLRLRPDGDRGALCLSVNSYELYYESHGQSWERMMLLKARTVAGDLEVGKLFKKKVKPFVFRRSLDYRLLSELQDVKNKINKRVELKGKKIKHVKLGYGGIREIEFVVQTLQILHYTKFPQVFNRNTLKGIDLLTECKIMDKETAVLLSSSYRFLRKLEHMVQLENERQTHIVPEDSPTYDLYLERCGFDNESDFEYKYAEVTKSVNTEFAKLFSDDAPEEDSILAIFDNELTDEDAADILQEKGIVDSVKCVKIVRRIMSGQKSRPRLKSDRSVLKMLLPVILKELRERKDASQILSNFEKLLARSTTIYLLQDIFMSAPKILNRLINTFSYSSYLTNMILANIDLLDYVYDPKDIKYEANVVCEDMWARTAKYRGDLELELEASRIRHRAYIFNVGYAYLNKRTNIVDMMQSLTALAKGTVDYAFRSVHAELVERYGEPLTKEGKPCRYLLIGMGKVGSIEMSFGSDLDMIVLFEERGATNGEKSITNMEFFSKMVQRGNSFLNTFTRNGFLYKTDMRLRPSGSSGTLVVTMNSFNEYQKKSAMIWEKQALLRSSIINVDTPLADEFNRIKSNALFSCQLGDTGVQEVYDMRMRIEKEKGGAFDKNNIKAGYGGLLDIEFIAQMLQLKYGCSDEAFQTPNTHEALHAFKVAGVIKERDFNSLHKGYLLFRHLENLVRIYENSDTSILPTSEELREKIASFYGFKKNGAETLMSEYLNIRRAVRGAFNRIFERITSEDNTGS
ncbi:MAG: bifunctional [glutamate--ammonia ligase]-adenylyl-L-tyrosine phosphorylase/[glutamate--ammonia-ligase] adenylyltransferase [Denitrovibrio sp.]|nr:MAG: bifunctional [glutamate--ammonia ligase]-adenylyl-L-tyrosine phosphorylase/[glutamate--ammonia-ligase] adenylyltransferase [Denitrovibrio sp.]